MLFEALNMKFSCLFLFFSTVPFWKAVIFTYCVNIYIEMTIIYKDFKNEMKNNPPVPPTKQQFSSYNPIKITFLAVVTASAQFLF